MAERIRIRRKSRSHLRKVLLLSCILTWFRIRYHCAQPPFFQRSWWLNAFASGERVEVTWEKHLCWAVSLHGFGYVTTALNHHFQRNWWLTTFASGEGVEVTWEKCFFWAVSLRGFGSVTTALNHHFPKKLVADNIHIRRRSRSHMRKVLFLSCILTWFRLRYHCAQPPCKKKLVAERNSVEPKPLKKACFRICASTQWSRSHLWKVPLLNCIHKWVRLR